MRLLMLILFFPFSFEGENGRELLDTALEKCSRLESLEAFAGTYFTGTGWQTGSLCHVP